MWLAAYMQDMQRAKWAGADAEKIHLPQRTGQLKEADLDLDKER